MGPDETASDMPPNCVDCIFRLGPGEQADAVGQVVDGGLCGAGKGPTSLPFASTGEALETGAIKASGCSKFRVRRPGEPPTFSPEDLMRPVSIALPDPEALAKEGTPVGVARSCMNCPNFIPPSESVEAGLWNTGLCAARGIMITQSLVVKTATECPNWRVGPRDPKSLSRMHLFPEYTIKRAVKSDADSMERSVIDPQDYETDHEISESDAKMGIRAWRKVEDPEGKHSIFLPIFDRKFFTPDMQKLIPKTGDDEHPEDYVDHMGIVYAASVLWMNLDETPALWGVAGTGKTEFYRHMAWLMGLPFHRISITASTEVEDLAGKMHFSKEKGTYFEYGRLPKAWMSPGIVCLDEPNVGPHDVWQFIRPLTDNSKQLVLDMNNGERIERHHTAFLGMAMNPDWDVRNAGAEPLADADGSRIAHIFVELPPPAVEREIIRERCLKDNFKISGDQLDMVARIAADLRKVSENETLSITWGVRQQIKAARALQWFTPERAYRLAAADYLEPAQRDIIMDIVKSNKASEKVGPKGGHIKSTMFADTRPIAGGPSGSAITIHSTAPSMPARFTPPASAMSIAKIDLSIDTRGPA